MFSKREVAISKEKMKKLEDAYNESGKRVSNLGKCIDIAFEMTGNLHRRGIYCLLRIE